MPPFRNVNAGRAGHRAIGILVPPGSRTLVIVRPRSLSLDLVMVRRNPPGFKEESRQAAGLAAQNLAKALAEGEAGQVVVVPASSSEGYWVEALVDSSPLIACPRRPGQPYVPLVYASPEEAERAADELRSILFPAHDANMELYTNLSQFER
jgi:hypothetical protein